MGKGSIVAKRPDFIVIGPGRTGSTLLYESFLEHPQIRMAKDIKETNFFNTYYKKGLKWYESFFDYASDGNYKYGEISNLYIFDSAVAARIAKDFPDMKIISILRNPIDRLKSVINFRKKTGQIPLDLSVQEYLMENPKILNEFKYFNLLSKFREVFPDKQIYFGFYEDLITNPNRFISDIFNFIGVDSNFVPATISKKVNASGEIRIKFARYFIHYFSHQFRRFGFLKLLNTLKRSRFINGLLYTKNIKELKFSDQIQKMIFDEIHSDIINLEKLCGRNLDSWKIM